MALGTVHFLFSAAPGRAHQHMALRAAEVLVLLAELHSQEELPRFGLKIRPESDELPVFFKSFITSFAEHTEQRPCVETHADEQEPWPISISTAMRGLC